VKITQHLGKITWSLADKGLYVLYGFVQLLQIKALPPDVYGVFSLLVALNTWIMIVSDGSALQGVIQFGVNQDDRRRVNAMAVTIHATIVFVASLAIFALQIPLTAVFNEPRFATVATMLPLYCLLTLPRMFCLKILYRDIRMRDLFIADVVWFGVRTALTVWMLSNGTLRTLDDIILIDFAGMAASSLIAVVLTRRDLVFGWKGLISAREYIRFGVPLALATALNSTPRQLDVLIIQAYFGAAVVGVYNPAKNLYRFFEQAFDAVITLLYPAAVRMYAQQRHEDLRTMVTKSMSLAMIPSILAVAVLLLGGSQVIIPLLGEKYAAAVGHFNVLSLAVLGMPFALNATIIAARGHSTTVVRYSAVGLVFGLAALFVIGEMGWEPWIGLGLMINTVVVGLLCTANVRREMRFPLSSLFRVVSDAAVAVRSKTGGKA
jgi:O-antigen/teichoic acid export membrane protein